MSTRRLLFLAFAALALAAGSLQAGFAGTDVFIPAVARASGLFGAQFYSSLWITNSSTTSSVTVQFQLYQRGSATNPAASTTRTLGAGETQRIDNCVETLFGLVDTSGAVRIVSPGGDVFVSSRTANYAAGATDKDSMGLFFSAIPTTFAAGLSEPSQLQGIAASDDTRYNFGFVETTGQPVTVRVTLKYPSGGLIGTKNYDLPARGQNQWAVTDVNPGVSGLSNALLEAEVISGSGRVLLYGTQVQNVSQDSAGFEMSFRKSLLGSTSLAGVATLNGLSGDVTLAAGANVTLTPAGNTITISSVGGSSGGGGVPSVNGITSAVTINGSGGTSVSTAGNLITVGSATSIPPSGPAGGSLTGTYPSPTLADASVTKSKLSASGGTNGQFLATNGSNLQWANAGLTLPFAQTVSTVSGNAFEVRNTTTTGGTFPVAIYGAGTWNGISGLGAVGVWGGTNANGAGVWGQTNSLSNGSYGVLGQSIGTAGLTAGVYGENASITGSAAGVWGEISSTSPGIFSTGVRGENKGTGSAGVGVWGSHAGGGFGVYGTVGNTTTGYAGWFSGKMYVSGTISKPAGSFKIDHPLDPENKYLYHSFVESPEMKNVYDGVVALDGKGEAVVELPEWFETLNKDFRYQLTCIGGHAPVYVSQEVTNNRFAIAGGRPGLKVSWQLTGVRQDPYANAHRIVVEEEKEPENRGYYLQPDVYNQPASRGIATPERIEAEKDVQSH